MPYSRVAMPFLIKKFSDCRLDDPFFDSLKEDYDEFDIWFKKKSKSGETAYVHDDENGMIQAFLYIKDVDCETVGDLIEEPRIKMGTLKINPASEGQRLGEGAIGIALWKWQKSDLDQIYVTVFPKHKVLIDLLEKYGFEEYGKKGEECVFAKDKRKMRYDTIHRSFPYFNPNLSRGKYIPIHDEFHDSMFQYSELKNTMQNVGDLSVSNGITKNFIATPSSNIDYRPGDIVFIYRMHQGPGLKGCKSVVTSYCIVSKIEWFKKGGKNISNYDDYLKFVGNKSVYTSEVLKKEYEKKNLCVIELLYSGYFGAGHNITHNSLKEAGLFEKHPYEIKLNREEINKIMRMGGKDEQDIIVDQSRTH